jgi:cytochrome c peroxidase
MAKQIFSSLAFLLTVVIFYNCQQKSDPKLTTSYIDLPQAPYQYYSGASNDYIPTLGRVLFYDSRLSANNSVSCASCHKQASAFADNSQFSRGFAGEVTLRNSMPIQNLANNGFFLGGPMVFFSDTSTFPLNSVPLFWDGRETLVEAQVLRPITNHIEMGMDIKGLILKLSQLGEYAPLFRNAYGDSVVTEERISAALSRFISSIKSNQTKFDLYQQGKAQLTAAEQVGFSLFLNKYNCNNCHQLMPTFIIRGDLVTGDSLGGYVPAQQFLDIGLDAAPRDIGRADFTGNASDIGRFKIPTLRNVALTAPYMHDGRFATLNEVIEHYSTGISASPNLDPVLVKNGLPRQMMISEGEKQSIIAFLNTLTDYQMITDPKFSSPFKYK